MLIRTSNLMRFSAVALVLFTFATFAKAQSSWAPIKLNTGGNDLNTVYFIDSKRGWVGGDSGYLSRTENGGSSWTRQNVGTKAAINDIYFRDPEAGFFLAGNSIFVTRDNGVTWTQLKIFSPEEFDGADVELYSVRFANKKKGWVVGSVSKRDRVIDSVLVYTEDGPKPPRVDPRRLCQRQTRLDRRRRRNDPFHARRRSELDKTDRTRKRHVLSRRLSQRQKGLGRRRTRHAATHH
jgi:photosystem II stability/assembly factor-like uncharacterized protein